MAAQNQPFHAGVEIPGIGFTGVTFGHTPPLEKQGNTNTLLVAIGAYILLFRPDIISRITGGLQGAAAGLSGTGVSPTQNLARQMTGG